MTLMKAIEMIAIFVCILGMTYLISSIQMKAWLNTFFKQIKKREKDDKRQEN